MAEMIWSEPRGCAVAFVEDDLDVLRLVIRVCRAVGRRRFCVLKNELKLEDMAEDWSSPEV